MNACITNPKNGIFNDRKLLNNYISLGGGENVI